MTKKDPRFKNVLPEANSVSEYLDGYVSTVTEAIGQVSVKELERAFKLLEKIIKRRARIFVGGNGGSAAISDHLCCDWTKGTYDAGKAPLKVHSMVANSPVLTALANDFSYEESLSKQLEMLAEPGDAVVLISSSGNSPNIVKAAQVAARKKLPVIGLCGFSGGKLKDLADVCLYVPCNNYGVVEDAHQMLMHVLAQFLAKVRDSKA